MTLYSDKQRSPTLPSSSVMAAKRLFKLPADDAAFTTPALSVAEGHRLGREIKRIAYEKLASMSLFGPGRKKRLIKGDAGVF